MSFLSNLIKKAAPIVAAAAPGTPVGTAAAVVSYKQAQQNVNYQRKLQEEAIERQRKKAMELNIQPTIPQGTQLTTGIRTLQQPSGFASGFGSFLTDIGRNIVDPISNIFSSPAVRPFITQQSATQPAIPSQSLGGGQESAESGASSQAFIGGLPNILGAAGRFLGSRAGQVGLAGGSAIVGSMVGGQPTGMRMTRKMKSQARTVLNMVGGDLNAAANILGIDQGMLVALLLKRFRNDGPVVTKAALRKTRTTVRRLKSMCDMYDSLRPAATRRRTPMKRASSTTLIKN